MWNIFGRGFDSRRLHHFLLIISGFYYFIIYVFGIPPVSPHLSFFIKYSTIILVEIFLQILRKSHLDLQFYIGTSLNSYQYLSLCVY